MKPFFPVLIAAVAAVAVAAPQAKAVEVKIPTTNISTPHSLQYNNSIITAPQAVVEQNAIELNRLEIVKAKTRLQIYVFKQRLTERLSVQLADALEKKQDSRARLIAMQLAPKFGFKDYKAFLAEVTSGKFPTVSASSESGTSKEVSTVKTATFKLQNAQLWDASIDRLQTQQIASAK